MTEPSPIGTEEGCDRLLGALADEQGALEHLLFKLREQHLILASGEHRWLASCTAEVETALSALTEAGQRREQAAAGVHAAHGLPPATKLSDLADRVADEITCQLLHQRQRSLRDILDQVRRCSRQNRGMLAAGLAATNDALTLLGAVPTYDAAGGVGHGGTRPRAFDTRV